MINYSYLSIIESTIINFFNVLRSLDLLDNKNKIVKSNAIIEAKYKLSLLEQKLILLMASLINREDTDFKFCRVKIQTFINFLGIQASEYHGIYDNVRRIVKQLASKPVSIEREDGSWLILNWVASAEYIPKEGVIEFEFSSKLRPYLLELKKSFTTYRLKYVISLNSSYSIRIYELLKQYEKIGSRRFLVDELKQILGVEKGYKLYADFKRNVLEVARKELPSKSDLIFEYREIKKAQKVIEIEFFNIAHNEPPDAKTNQLKLNLFEVEVSEGRGGQNSPVEANSERLRADLEARGVSAKQITEIIGKFPEEVIENYIDFYDWTLKKGKNAPESGAWLYKAISENWQPPKGFKTRTQLRAEETSRRKQAEQRELLEKQRENERNKTSYEQWLAETPAQRWEAEIFSFRFRFREQFGRKPTAEEIAEAREKYLANPETPEEYQVRCLGKILFPVESKTPIS